MRDLIICVPDKSIEYSLLAGLSRFESLGTRPFDFEIRVHTGRDGGVRKDGVSLVNLLRYHFSHALIVFDYEGSGAINASNIEREIDNLLAQTWGQCGKAIVIEPEVDIWMWGSDTSLASVVSWNRDTRIRDWITEKGFELDSLNKPRRPKEALQFLLRETGKKKSAVNYKKIAESIGLGKCQDDSFLRMRNTLREWFPTAT